MQCRFIDTGFNDAYMNMAIDEAILKFCEAPTLRLYNWYPAAMSVGYNQNVHNEINLEKCSDSDIGVVRRITGGKAVFHDKEITYSFIVPESLNLLPKEVNESYKKIANAMVIALENLGIKSEVKKTPERIKTPICFNSANWYELLVNGKKISGSAQRRMDGKILQHGSLLINFDYEKNCSLFNTNNSPDSLNSLKERVTSIKHELNSMVSYTKIVEAIKSGFEENFGFSLKKDSLTTEEKIFAENLKGKKYMTYDWNYGSASKTI